MPPLIWLTRLLVYGLAVFRLARLISWEEGPAGIFKHVRRWFGTRIVVTRYETLYEQDSTCETGWAEVLMSVEEERAETPLARFISCPLCVSAWLALPAVVGVFLPEIFFDIVASWLALSSITVILHRNEQ